MKFTSRRVLAVRRTLSGCACAMPTVRQLELLTSYVLGHLSRRQTNSELRLAGPALHVAKWHQPRLLG